MDAFGVFVGVHNLSSVFHGYIIQPKNVAERHNLQNGDAEQPTKQLTLAALISLPPAMESFAFAFIVSARLS